MKFLIPPGCSWFYLDGELYSHTLCSPTVRKFFDREFPFGFNLSLSLTPKRGYKGIEYRIHARGVEHSLVTLKIYPDHDSVLAAGTDDYFLSLLPDLPDKGIIYVRAVSLKKGNK